MNPQKIVGIVLLVVGVVLAFMGFDARDSLADQVSHGVTGRYTNETMWYILGGIGAGITGFFMLVGPRKLMA